MAKKISISFKKPNFDKKTLQKLYKQIGIIGILIGFVLLCFSIYYIVYEGGVSMNFIVMDLDDFIFGNEEWHESER